MPSLNLERDTEISVLKRQLEKREIELARRDAVAAIRASGGSAAILLPTMLAAAVVSDTPNGSEVTYRHGPRKVGAADFVKALADDPDTAPAFRASRKAHNPFAEETFNLIEQFRLKKIDPSLATTLELEAKRGR